MNRQFVAGVSWNGLGLLFPLIVGVWLLSKLLGAFNATEFGILALAWALIGSTAVLDFGLGAAITRLLGQDLQSNAGRRASEVMGTGLVASLVVGSVLCALVYVSARYAVALLKVPPDSDKDAVASFRAISLVPPCVIVSTVLQSALAVYGKFATVAFIRLPTGVWNFIGPLLAVKFGLEVTGAVLPW